MTSTPKPLDVIGARKALIDEVISMYHTTRMADTPAADHILSKRPVSKAFDALAFAEQSGAQKPKWTTVDDPVGALAIELAAYAGGLEEDEGEWSWRDIANAAIRLVPARATAVEREAVAKVHAEHGGSAPWWWAAAFDDGADDTARRLREQDLQAADAILSLLQQGEGK